MTDLQEQPELVVAEDVTPPMLQGRSIKVIQAHRMGASPSGESPKPPGAPRDAAALARVEGSRELAVGWPKLPCVSVVQHAELHAYWFIVQLLDMWSALCYSDRQSEVDC